MENHNTPPIIVRGDCAASGGYPPCDEPPPKKLPTKKANYRAKYGNSLEKVYFCKSVITHFFLK